MSKKDIKILILLSLSYLTLDFKQLFAECLTENCYPLVNSISKFSNKKKYKLVMNSINSTNLSDKNINFKYKINSYKFLEKDIQKLDTIFSTLLISNETNIEDNSNNFSYEIESDTQYFESDVFYAEGNVQVILPNGVLSADKISYDQSKKIFIAHKNINFQKGDQYFKADYFEYDFLIKRGFIDNIYGIIDSQSINDDLNLKNNPLTDNYCKNKKLDLNDLPSEVEFLDSSNERYKNQIGSNKLKFDFSSIKNWRFKSKKVFLEENEWKSELVDFTNDPYNKPQLIVRSKDFTGEINDGKTKLTSNKTSIIFEDKLSIPIIGKRTISDEVSQLRWGLGYDQTDKDGFYILRNFDPIYFNEDKDFTLDLQPFFLMQRAIEGKSNSFRGKESSIFTDNIEKDIDFLDYFALNSKFKGKFKKWNLDIDSELKTLNSYNFYDAFSTSINLVRNLYTLSEETECNDLLNKKEKYKNFSTNLGFYSIFDKDDIYTSLGTKFISNFEYKRNSLNKKFDVVFDFGQYQAKTKNKTENNNYIKKLDRYGLTTSLSQKYKIIEFNKNSEFNYPYNKYAPKKPEQGLFINAKIGAGLYEYSDNSSQSFLSMSLGSNLSFGNLKRNFFDYTSISIFPEFIIKNGESPFVFDDFNNDSRIKFNFKQQLFGPLLLGFKGDYNINTNSSKFATFQNKKLSLDISRRAYSIGLSYDQDDKSVFLGFEIFNFGDSNFTKDF